MTSGCGRKLCRAIGVLAVLVLLCGLMPFQVIWDDGMNEIPFHFQVIDAQTRQPLPEAQVALYDEAADNWEKVNTGAGGEAIVALPCITTCKRRSGVFLSYSRRSIFYPPRVLVISRAGYKDTPPLNLTDLTGPGHGGGYLPPSPVHIELEKE